MGQKWPYLDSSKLDFTVIRPHLYTCVFLIQKMHLIEFNHWTLAKKLSDRNVPLDIVKLFIFWYREQEFMVRWGNSLSMTFRCSNGIKQCGLLSPLLYNVYTDDLNHHLLVTGVGCYVGGAWVNSLSYADDMVLLAPTVTALQTLLEVWGAYAGPHDIVYNTTKTVCMHILRKQSQGWFSTRVRLGNEEVSFCRGVSLHRTYIYIYILENLGWSPSLRHISLK